MNGQGETLHDRTRTHAIHPCEVLTYNPKTFPIGATVVLADPKLRDLRLTVTRSGHGRISVEQGDVYLSVRRRDILGTVEPSVIGVLQPSA
jgi:hypothetical protein